jgi:hypothetical protein
MTDADMRLISCEREIRIPVRILRRGDQFCGFRCGGSSSLGREEGEDVVIVVDVVVDDAGLCFSTASPSCGSPGPAGNVEAAHSSASTVALGSFSAMAVVQPSSNESLAARELRDTLYKSE